MITGRSISAIAIELDRQRKTKFDFIVPTSFLGFTLNGQLLNKDKGKSIPLTDHAHKQLANFLVIPGAYYDRMRSQTPELLQQSVDTWFTKQPAGTRRMVRTIDGKCRAFLSDRYLPIDNWDTLNVLLPAVQEAGCEVVSAEITDERLYVKAVTPRITGEIRVGDQVQAGLIISNSEIGKGRVQISPIMYRLVCKNGLIVQDYSMKRHHVGRRISDDDIETSGIYSKETIAADIKAFLLKARDSVKAVLQQDIFSNIVNRAKAAAGETIENAVEYMEDVTNRYGLSEEEGSGILQQYIAGGDNTRYGIINAITYHAHEVADYDRSVQLEQIGGELLYRRAA